MLYFEAEEAHSGTLRRLAMDYRNTHVPTNTKVVQRYVCRRQDRSQSRLDYPCNFSMVLLRKSPSPKAATLRLAC
jgi:hypothetical protein